MPSISFINRVYPPSEGATGRVLEFVAEGFAKAGWKVSVIVTSQAVPRKPPDGMEIRNGVTVHTVRVSSFSKGNLLERAIAYVTMIPSLFFLAMTIPRADVVVTMTDPPMLVCIGVLIGLFRRCRMIHWAQDLYPEVAEELGVLRSGGVVAGMLRAISSRSIRCHEISVVPGRCVKNRLIGRGIPPSLIQVILNTGVEQKITPMLSSRNAFRERHGLGDAFIVQYSGNMGLAHDFETVIEAAEVIQEIGEENILFLFVVAGPREAALRDAIQTKGLRNVVCLPAQPEHLLAESLGAGDLHLVTMRPGMSGLVVPSKLYGVMAASRPCLFVGPEDSEISQEVIESGVGEVVRSGDFQTLARKIIEYRDSPVMRQKCGERGYSWVRTRNSLHLFIETAFRLSQDSSLSD